MPDPTPAQASYPEDLSARRRGKAKRKGKRKMPWMAVDAATKGEECDCGAPSHDVAAWAGAIDATSKSAGDKSNPAGEFKARHLIRWFNLGADGKIAWGTPGDWRACVTIASRHMRPDQAKGFCNLRHHDATGSYPGHAPAERALHGAKRAARAAKSEVPVAVYDEDGTGYPVEPYALRIVDGPALEVVGPEGTLRVDAESATKAIVRRAGALSVRTHAASDGTTAQLIDVGGRKVAWAPDTSEFGRWAAPVEIVFSDAPGGHLPPGFDGQVLPASAPGTVIVPRVAKGDGLFARLRGPAFKTTAFDEPRHPRDLFGRFRGLGVDVSHHGEHHEVKSPYNPNFISRVKALGGRWRPSDKVWSVPSSRAEELSAALEAAYGGATDRRHIAKPMRAPAPRGKKLASPRQVDYAIRLVEANWFDSDMGQGFNAPTVRELEQMSSAEISEIIDDMKGPY